MMTNLTVRPATQSDLGTIVDFNARLALETEGLLIDREILEEGVGALLADGSRGFYNMASSEGRPVGQMMHTREWSDWRNGVFWWIQSVYVLPAFRGRGVYRRMYAFVKQRASQNPEVCGFRLYVEKNNQIAQKTYQTLGMAETHYLLYEEELKRVP